MKSLHASRNSKNILKALIDPSRPDVTQWSPHDLKAILRHQLATSLTAELDRFVELSSLTPAQASLIITSSGCHSFEDLLRIETPSLSALKMLKDYAKASLAKEGDLPKDVARVLYILAILRGRQTATGSVSSLDIESTDREARRCLTFGWLPEDIRELLRHGTLDNKETRKAL